MIKAITAGLAGLALIASQAAARTNSVFDAGSRVGSTSASSDDMEGGPPILLLLAAAGIITIFAVAVSQDDHPSSP